MTKEKSQETEKATDQPEVKGHEGPTIGKLVKPVFKDLLNKLSAQQRAIVEYMYIEGNTLADTRAHFALPMDRFNREYNAAVLVMFNDLLTRDK